MVIGGNKPAQIHREKLRQAILTLFQEVLSCPNRRMLVIGYGFVVAILMQSSPNLSDSVTCSCISSLPKRRTF